MKKVLNGFLFLTIAAISFVGQAHAEGAAGGKVVVIDLQRAVLATTAAREQLKALESEKEFAENRKKAEKLQKEMDAKVADAQKNGTTWSPEKQAEYRREMEMYQKEMQLTVQKLQAEKQAVFGRISKEIDAKLKKVLEQLIKEQNIAIMLDRGAALFVHPESDITEKVTQRLNESK